MDEKIKVTDKRMFTADGELREQEPESSESADTNRVAPPPPERAPSPPAQSSAATAGVGSEAEGADEGGRQGGTTGEQARSDLGARKGDFPAPTFTDLIGLLAQPIAMFLGDAKLPGGESEENLPLARFHIDLLELVESKTRGNISSEEAKLLGDLLYQLRMRYVQKAE